MPERQFVRDLMTVGVATCPPDTPVIEIARLLLNRDLEAVVVLDHEGHAVGVVGQDELIQAYTHENCRDLTAGDVMRDGVPQLPPDLPLTAAAQMMRDQGVRTVFLMHHAGGITYPAATLSYRHLLRHLAAASDDELNDLGIAAARQNPIEAFKQRRDAAKRRDRDS